QIEFFDEDIDHANGIVLADPVFQAFRKQRGLTAIDSLNEAPHPILPQIARESYRENQNRRCVFTQAGSIAAHASSDSQNRRVITTSRLDEPNQKVESPNKAIE